MMPIIALKHGFPPCITKWSQPTRIRGKDSFYPKSALQELSAPLLPIFEKISVMPLIGTIDTERAKLIIENLLIGVVKIGQKWF